MGNTKFTSTTYGDWKSIVNKLEGLDKKVDEAMNVALAQTTLKGEKIAVKHIVNQDLKWRKLNKAYKKRKIALGKSEKTLISSSTYLQSITSFVAGGYGFVGVKRGVYAKSEEGKEPIEVANIALIMEYGSEKANIKPRRLWKPTLLELKSWIRDSGIFVKEIKKKL